MDFHAEEGELLPLADHPPLEASLADRGLGAHPSGGGPRDLRDPALLLCKRAAIEQPCDTAFVGAVAMEKTLKALLCLLSLLCAALF